MRARRHTKEVLVTACIPDDVEISHDLRSPVSLPRASLMALCGVVLIETPALLMDEPLQVSRWSE